MAEKITRQVLCDLHLALGVEIESAKTIPFMFDGESAEIDLCLTDVVQLRETLSPILKAGRPVKTQPASRNPARSPRMTRSESQKIRAWAEQQPDLKGRLKERGRVPEDIKARYYATARQQDRLQNAR